MPPSTYHALCQKYTLLLSTFYAHAATPREVPEKSSHGDIDILVCTPLDRKHPLTSTSLSAALGAVTKLPQNPTTLFAVPYPGHTDDHVQVDVQRCPSDLLFDWQLFLAGLGDFWNILGTAIRPFGLTASDRGLHVRIPEIEHFDKRRSLIFLTCNPDAALRFCALDVEAYKKGWEKLDEMFSFLARGRFMRKETYIRDGLKANDRKRLDQRAVYRQFVEEWIPKWEIGDDDERGNEWRGKQRRAEVLEEALEVFGKREDYESIVGRWRVQMAEKLIKAEIKLLGKIETIDYWDAWVNFLGQAAPAV